MTEHKTPRLALATKEPYAYAPFILLLNVADQTREYSLVLTRQVDRAVSSALKRKAYVQVAVIPSENLRMDEFSGRAPDLSRPRSPFPYVWMCAAGGKVRADETYEEAALREMEEELGQTASLEFVTVSGIDLSQEKTIAHVFTTKEHLLLDNLQVDHSEIQYLKAFSLEELKKRIEHEPDSFAPTFRVHVERFLKCMKHV